MVKTFAVGDRVVLTCQAAFNHPPVGTVGVITKLYEATGGKAAYVDWDCDGDPFDMALLRDLEYATEKDIEESDKGLDFLFE